MIPIRVKNKQTNKKDKDKNAAGKVNNVDQSIKSLFTSTPRWRAQTSQ